MKDVLKRVYIPSESSEDTSTELLLRPQSMNVRRPKHCNDRLPARPLTGGGNFVLLSYIFIYLLKPGKTLNVERYSKKSMFFLCT